MNLKAHRRFQVAPVAILLAILAFTGSTASAQINLSDLQPVRPVEKPVTIRAEVEPTHAAPGARVTLRITAEIVPEHYVYSITQPPGGPTPTKITVDPIKGLTTALQFIAEQAPEISIEPLFDNLEVETHHDRVTWSASFRLASDLAPGPLPLSGTAKYLVCNPRSCRPGSDRFETTLTVVAGKSQSPPAVTTNSGQPALDSTTYQHRAAKFRVFAMPSTVQPGETITLTVEAAIEAPYHIYATTQPWSPDEASALPTSIEVSQFGDLEPLGADFKGPPAIEKEIFDLPAHYHEGRVAWSRQFRIPENASPGEYPLAGAVGYMLCTDQACDPPAGFEFRGSVTVGERVDASPSYFGIAPLGNPGRVIQLIERVARQRTSQPDEPSSTTFSVRSSQKGMSGLPAALGFGFLAGLILNVMPCVLPVISLKIYGFVKQAGEAPGHVRLLGLSFGAGILFVFLILAGLAAFAGLGWGQQFQSDRFLVAMIALLVVFALGMFNVYTIRLPGLVNTAQAATAQREGLAASFAKGMLATVLATPCSGPFLGATLTYALTQPPLWIFTIFTSIGLGMASPYVVLALNPNWLKVMPRPGEWMNTLREAMGFLLLATAIWLLWQRRSDGEFVIWTVAFCTFTAFAAWIYGRWSIPHAPQAKRLAAPLVALSIVGFAAYFCYSDLAQASPSHWEPYSRERLVSLQKQGKTVIVDWTADW